jgi:chromosome segregation ATPase
MVSRPREKPEAFVMIEQAMLFGIGFLVASLFNLLFVPLVHNRAVRLTMRRLEAATPFSMAEIQAEKDQLRAEFAMSTRRLEMSVEQLKTRAAGQLADLGRKSMAIGRLKQELDEKTATLAAIAAREAALREQLQSTEQEFSRKSDKAQTVEKVLVGKEAELAKLTAALDERTSVSDSQRIEIATLKTQIESLKAKAEQAQSDLKDTKARMDQERVAAATASDELTQERTRTAELGTRIGELDRQLGEQTSESEGLVKRIHELEERLTEQGRMLVEREYDARKAREEAGASEGLKGEKARLEQELQAVRAENTRLESELTALRQGAEASWATERVENALLRERINDVAAEVVRLTQALEGPGSPIEAMLAEDRPEPTAEAPRSPADGGAPRGDLVERIRALQARASRVAPSTDQAAPTAAVPEPAVP